MFALAEELPAPMVDRHACVPTPVGSNAMALSSRLLRVDLTLECKHCRCPIIKPGGWFMRATQFRALFDQADMRPSLRAKRSNPGPPPLTSDPLDCFVASLLAMTIQSDRIPLLERYPNGLNRLGDSRNS